MDFKDYVKRYSDFPKKDVVFWDFTDLLKNPDARSAAIRQMLTFLKDKKIDKIAAIEAKGFTIGSILAHEMNIPLVLIRKPNLIPGKVYSETFVKEYGTGEYCIKADAVLPGERVAVIYDIMAGSGASLAASHLIERMGGVIGGLLYVTELDYLNGRTDLSSYELFSLVRITEHDKAAEF